MPRSRASVAVFTAAALWCLAPRAAAGQINLAPTIGVYIPTAELVQAASGQQYKQEIAITLGGRLGVALGQRAGLEAPVAYAPSNLKFSATGSSSTTSANILTGSGRVFVELVPRSSPVGLHLNGGAGLVHRSGTAYQGDPKSTDWGGVVGATVRVRLGQLLHLELHAEDFIYKAQYAPDPTTPGAFATVNKQLNDIHLGVGLGIPLLGLGGGGGATERPRP